MHMASTVFSLSTSILSVSVGRIFESVCLFVCLLVYPQRNAKSNDPKVSNSVKVIDRRISYKWYGLGWKVKGQG